MSAPTYDRTGALKVNPSLPDGAATESGLTSIEEAVEALDDSSEELSSEQSNKLDVLIDILTRLDEKLEILINKI